MCCPVRRSLNHRTSPAAVRCANWHAHTARQALTRRRGASGYRPHQSPSRGASRSPRDASRAQPAWVLPRRECPRVRARGGRRIAGTICRLGPLHAAITRLSSPALFWRGHGRLGWGVLADLRRSRGAGSEAPAYSCKRGSPASHHFDVTSTAEVGALPGARIRTSRPALRVRQERHHFEDAPRARRLRGIGRANSASRCNDLIATDRIT